MPCRTACTLGRSWSSLCLTAEVLGESGLPAQQVCFTWHTNHPSSAVHAISAYTRLQSEQVRCNLGSWKAKDQRKTLGWDQSKGPSRWWERGNGRSLHVCCYHLLTTFPVHILSPGCGIENEIKGRQLSTFCSTSIYVKQSIPHWHRNTPSLWSPHCSSLEREVVLGAISLTASRKHKHRENSIYSKESEV